MKIVEIEIAESLSMIFLIGELSPSVITLFVHFSDILLIVIYIERYWEYDLRMSFIVSIIEMKTVEKMCAR